MKTIICLVVALLSVGAKVEAQSLKSTRDSVAWEYLYAERHGLTFIPDTETVFLFIEGGVLVSLYDNPHLKIDDDVAFPYVLPTTKRFVDWFESKYRSECGTELTVTSGTRPYKEQPPNASRISAHPTGMVVDLRVPRDKECLAWFEETLRTLKSQNVIDVIQEEKPPHYHMAVYPDWHVEYLAQTD